MHTGDSIDSIANDAEAETALLTQDNDAYNLNEERASVMVKTNSVESSYEDLSGGQDIIYDYIK